MSKPAATSPVPETGPARQGLRAARRGYLLRRAAAVLLPAVAGLLLLGVLARHWPAAQGGLLVLAGLTVLAVGVRLWPLRQVDELAIAARLDRQHAALEDSTGLLLHPTDALNLLERLQQQRVAARLGELHAAGTLSLPVALARPAGLTALLLAGAAAAWLLPSTLTPKKPAEVAVRFTNPKPMAAGSKAARIVETRLWVTPPAYTRQLAFAPTQASFSCPQGSRVRWQVRVNEAGPVPELELGRQRLRLRAVPGQPRLYAAEQVLNTSQLYRLRLGSTLSDDYAIDVRPDQAPALRISMPKPYTLVEFGTRPLLPVQASARDDYGLSRAELVITVAQGQGEAVKFREVRRHLSAGLKGQPRQASLTTQLDLPALGLTYGDELYFYLSARDNAGRSARTDSYLVQWQDTAVASSLDDMSLGAKVTPAYFRSQRQIIIDTEKLLAEKPRLAAAVVAERANALGFDQQSLRLRYGKFMGEEVGGSLGAAPRPPIAEDEVEEEHHSEGDGHDHHDHAPAPASATSPPASAETEALMAPYVHRHDDAETADFLEPAVKAKLRAVLDQMWAAELRLRTGHLSGALPYEYRALRLLKQVQQQTRAYVRKAGFVPPPMPEATLRLSGELAGAAAPSRQWSPPAPAAQPALRAALRWLASPTAQGSRASIVHQLEQAGTQLSAAALQQPGRYLPALRALRQLVTDARAGRTACADCRAPVERALTDLLALPPPALVPPAAPDRLARRYYQELTR